MYNKQNYNTRPNRPNSPMSKEYENHTHQNMAYNRKSRRPSRSIDRGPEPYVVNINEATLKNENFRTALWTGEHLQLTLMSIDVRDEIGLEMHPDVDQFIRVEQGQGLVCMGNTRDNLYYRQRVFDDYAIFIPAGTWHNLINTGCVPLKVYSIYAPPNHPRGTIHKTRRDAMEEEH